MRGTRSRERWLHLNPHGMPTTEAPTINAGLLAFIRD